MAHGLNSVLNRASAATVRCKNEGKSGIGSRRIFAPHFKLQVLDSYRNDADCKGNQRATARKYGIHRRQIQKWLQCENNLRNSVGKCKAATSEARKCGVELSLRSGQHRQRDDLCAEAYSQSLAAYDTQATKDPYHQTTHAQDTPVPDAYSQCILDIEPNVPTLPTVKNEVVAGSPLDYTIHSRGQPVSPRELGTPIDLSFKRITSLDEPGIPICCSLANNISQRVPSPYLGPLIQPHPDAWDLSVRAPKRSYEEVSDCSSSSPSSINKTPTKPVKLFKPYLDNIDDDENSQEEKLKIEVPPCCKRYIQPLPESELHYYSTNNNNILPDYGYTLHELQPKSSLDYYYTINKNYIYSPEYDRMSICSSYDSTGLIQIPSPPLKQRQSYSVDFKLSAIECYYQDSICKGNQRAVATKYNIHRRQVQKWLKQEDELRNRNDSKHLTVIK